MANTGNQIDNPFKALNTNTDENPFAKLKKKDGGEGLKSPSNGLSESQSEVNTTKVPWSLFTKSAQEAVDLNKIRPPDKTQETRKILTQAKGKPNGSPFDMVINDEDVGKAHNTISEIMFGSGEEWKDPVKAIGEKVKGVTDVKDLNALNIAANVTRNTLMPDGFDAKRVYNENEIWKGQEATNQTAKMLKERADKYDQNVAPLKNILGEKADADLSGATGDLLDMTYTPDLKEAAVEWYATKNPQFAKELNVIKESLEKEGWDKSQYGGKIPVQLWQRISSGKMGQIQQMFLGDQDIQSFAFKERQNLVPAFKNAQEKILTDNPEYGINQVANEVSRARQSAGKNNPIIQYYGEHQKEVTNQIAEELYKDDPKKMAIYNQHIRDHQNDYIDAPSFFEKFAQGGKDVFNGLSNTITEPFTSTSETIRDKWKQEASNVSADPQGFSKIMSDVGHGTGFVASIIGGGEVLGGAAALNPTTANAIMTAGSFLGDSLAEGKAKFPDSPVKAWTSAILKTGLYTALSYEIFPGGKVKQAISKVEPELNQVVEKLASGEISREAAKMETTNLFKKAVELGGTTLTKNARIAAEMTGIKMITDTADKLMGAEPHDENYGEVAKSAFLSNILVAGLAARGEQKVKNKLAEESYYEAASNPKQYERVIQEAATKDPSINADELLGNLKYLSTLKTEMDNRGVPEDKQKKVLLNSIQEKVKSEQIASMPESAVTRRTRKEIRGLQEDSDNILGSIDTQSVLTKVNNAEYVNEKEINNAENELYEAIDKHPEASHLIEPLIEKLQNYEFTTKTETSTITEKEPTGRTAKIKIEIKPILDQSTGGPVSVTNDKGQTVKGVLRVEDGKYIVSDENGNKVASIGEKAINDRDLKLPSEEEIANPISFDDNGNVKSVTVKTRDGKLVTIENKEKALDIAIQLQADALGEIPDSAFNEIYKEVQKTVTKEVPKYPEKLESKEPVLTIDTGQAEPTGAIQAKPPEETPVPATPATKANQPPPAGPTQPASAGGSPPAGDMTKMANAVVDSFIEGKFGKTALDNIIAQLQDPREKAIYTGVRDRIQKGMLDPVKIRQRILTTKSGSEHDQAALLYDLANLKESERNLTAEINKETDPAKVKQLQNDLLSVQNDMMDNALANRYLGRSASSIFRIRQLWVDKNADLATMQNQYKASKGIKNLTPEQEAEIKGHYDKMREYETKIQTLKEELDKKVEENATLAAENERLEKLKGDAKKRKQADRGKKSEESIKKSNERIQKAKDNLKGLSGGQLSAGFDPRIAVELTKIAAEKVYQGYVKIDELVRNVFDEVRDHLPGWTEQDVRDHLFPKASGEAYYKARAELEKSTKDMALKIEEYRKLQKEYALKMFEWQKDRRMDMLQDRPFKDRLIDGILRYQRFAVLSYPSTIAKLIGVVAHQITLKPFKFGFQKLASAITPESIASKQGIWGNPTAKALGKYYSALIRNFSLKNLKEQFSGIDTKEIMYGDKFMYDEWVAAKGLLEMPGRSHGYIKSFIKNPEFAYAHEQISTAYINRMMDIEKKLKDPNLKPDEISKLKDEYNQYDVTNEDVMEKINNLALQHGKWAILMNDNKFVEKFQKWTRDTGIPGAIIKSELPIVKVPTNYVGRYFATKYGLIRAITGKGRWEGEGNFPGIIELAVKGTEKLTPEQADLLGRSLTLGTMGAAFFGLGYMLSGQIKENEDGSYQMFGKKISKNLVHSPEIESILSGAHTARGKENGDEFIKSMIESDIDMVKKMPFISMLEYGALPRLGQALFMKDAGKAEVQAMDAVDKKMVDMLVPGFVKQTAGAMDTKKGSFVKNVLGLGEKPERRWPKEQGIMDRIWQHFEMAIPGLRQNVPSTQPGLQLSDTQKENPVFKQFLNKGMELPHTLATSEKIVNKKTGETKKLSDYPDKKIEEYNTEHLKNLEESLKDLTKKGYVYVDNTGKVQYVKHHDNKKINLDDLDKKQLAQILRKAQIDATEKTKETIFYKNKNL